MSKVNYDPVMESEYQRGKRERLYPNEVLEKNWYRFRFTDEEIRQQAGHYALELLVEVEAVRESERATREIEISTINTDGQKVGSNNLLMRGTGIINNPNSPNDEGYLLQYKNYLGRDLFVETEELGKVAA